MPESNVAVTEEVTKDDVLVQPDKTWKDWVRNKFNIFRLRKAGLHNKAEELEDENKWIRQSLEEIGELKDQSSPVRKFVPDPKVDLWWNRKDN